MRCIMTCSITTLLLGGTAFANGPTSFPSALPPVSNHGECYAQVAIPAQYSAGSETVVTAEGFTDIEVTEPQFQTRTETVLTKEASMRFVVRQPSYRQVRERILTRPAHERLSVSAPQFSTVTETIQTSAPHLVWKRGNPGELRRQGYFIHSTADGRLRAPAHSGGYQGGSYATTQNGGDSCGPGCEIWCLVEEPGTSVTTSRRALTAPPQVVRTPVPAEYQTITKQVVSDPGGVQQIPVPAEYSTVQVQDLVRHAETFHVPVPPVLGQVGTKNLVSPERYEWRRVLCQPGTGSIHSSDSYRTDGGHLSYSSPSSSHSGTYSSGASYSSTGTVYSGGTTYSHSSTPTTGTGYSSGTTYTHGSSVSQPSSIGHNSHPTYQRRGPSRIRR